ncbi:major capsid protein [Roseibium salinum]|nr:major capsid protein [Roseibium salinum]
MRAKCEEVVDHQMNKLQGETTNGVQSVVSSSFFNKFISHAKVEKVLAAGAEQLGTPRVEPPDDGRQLGPRLRIR